MTARPATVPTGEVTFLFTDVQGSTALWERDPATMEGALAEHDRRLREVIERRQGYVFTTAGDSFAVAFSSPGDALAAAVESQLALADPCGDVVLRVRMGIHSGTATARDRDYFGAAVNRCARLMSAAHGGQILVSGDTRDRLSEDRSDDLDLVDCGQHRLKDLLRPVRVFQVRHPQLDERFPPLRTLEGPGIDIPVQLTSFVGRERELADVRALITNPDHRLITLTGAGGAGKTRLAYQAAADSLEDFPDGITAVELAPLNDGDLIMEAVAAAVGAQATPHVPLVDTIAERIDGKRLLLVLDNSEQRIETVAELARDLLVGCERLGIVATSRERLGTPGEYVYRVPSLTMPESRRVREGGDGAHGVPARREQAYIASVLASDSVQLFVERAELARAGFAVTADNVDDVVSICRRLDGIPLALELAAARLSVLSPAKIAKRLDERFRLLVGDSRGTLERHRTLEATIAWSYDQLSESARAVFRRASVFSGGFDIEAAEAICRGGEVEPWDVLGQVAELVDKSMLMPEEDETGEIRYRLLESMREYGAHQLAERGEYAAAAAAHAAYFVELSEELQLLQRSGDIGAALAGLEPEMDNVRAALRFLLGADRRRDAARLVGALGYLWYAKGMSREGVTWCRELFSARPALELDDELMAAALHAHATLLASWDEPLEGIEMLAQEVELRRRIGDEARIAAALNNLGNVLCDIGRVDEGEATLREAAEHFAAAGEPATLALASLGYSASKTGRYDEAVELFVEAHDQAVASDDAYGQALSAAGLGEAAVRQGRITDARRHLAAARAGYESLGVLPGVAYVDLLLALADLAAGASDSAARRLISSMEDPDVHWSTTTKFWVLQLAARLLPDRALAARLVGVAEYHYARAAEPQPDWVVEDLGSIRAWLEGELGDDAFAQALASGAHTAPADAVVAALDALAARAEASGAPDPQSTDPRAGPVD